jgi:hypothetical protein
MRSTIMTSAPGSPALLRQSIEEDGQIISYAARGIRGIISPPALDADQNNYSPTGLDTCRTIRLITNSPDTRVITGLDITAFPPAERDGVEIWFCNVGFSGAAHGSIELPNNSAGSDEISRFLNSNNGTSVLPIQGVARVWYDAIQARWRVWLGA